MTYDTNDFSLRELKQELFNLSHNTHLSDSLVSFFMTF